MTLFKKNKRKESTKGIALLFSVIVSSLLLTIALSVLNTAMKELSFSTSARDTGSSFFAADSGIECALLYDKSGTSVFIDPNAGGGGGEPAPTSITCNGDTVSIEGSYPSFVFKLLNLGVNSKSCALVSMFKDKDEGATKVISKGYNLGGDSDCSQTGLNSTERVIEVNY